MKIVSVLDAKAQLSDLIRAVAHGEEILIAQEGLPSVRLVLVPEVTKERKPGGMKGHFVMPDDFDDPLPDEVQSMFDGR